MANFHKLSLIGNLVSDPKFTPFQSGGGVAKIGIPVNFSTRKKDPATGEWKGDSFIINCDVFDNAPRNLGSLVMQYLRKGSLVYVEGRLKENRYTSTRTGAEVVAVVLVVDNIQFLDRRPADGDASGDTRVFDHAADEPEARPAPRPTAAPAAAPTRTITPVEQEESDENGGGGTGTAVAAPPKAAPKARGKKAPAPAPAVEANPDDIPF